MGRTHRYHTGSKYNLTFIIVKSSTVEWSNEKNQLIKKITDLEKEVYDLKRANNDITNKINHTPKDPNLRSLSNNNAEKKYTLFNIDSVIIIIMKASINLCLILIK